MTAYHFGVIGLGALAVISGLALCKPVQLYWLARMLGGFRLVRIWHFVAMCGLSLSYRAASSWSQFMDGTTSFL